MGFLGRITTRSGLAFNCRTENRDGVKIIKCEPLEKKNDIKKALSERPVEMIVTETGKLEFTDDGGVDRKIMEELDEYISRML